MIKLPRLLKNDGSIEKIINPIKVSITQTIVPLSTATITVPIDEKIPARQYVELFTPYGSAGVFRVRSPRDAYGDNVATVELEHAISEVGDYLVKAEYSDMYAAQTAMKNVFSHYKGGRWKLGSITALGTGKVALEAKYTRVLDSMIEILDQKRDCMMSFDFTTKPWTVSIVKKGTSVSAEGRLSRNISNAVVVYDDTELCTRAYYQTFSKNKSGETVGKWNYKDADTKSKYGVFEREVPTSSDMTSEEITLAVDSYLSEHKNPKASIDIEGEELSQITGESMDKFTIGKLFRLVISDYNTVVENNITEVSWDDVYNAPRNVNVKLGEPEDTVVSFIHNLDSTGSGGGGGGAKKKEEDKWKEYYTRINQTDYNISMYAARTDKANNILEQAGLDINSKGVLVYATDNKNSIGARFNVQSNKITQEITDRKSSYATLSARITVEKDRITQEVTRASAAEGVLSGRITTEANKISLVVEQKGGKNVVKTASIVAGINDQTGSYVKIKADTINLSGYVTATSLNAVEAKFDNIFSGNTTALWIKANQGNIPKLTVGNDLTFKSHGVYWQAVTINGTSYHLMGYVG